MAGLSALVKALARLAWRDIASFRALQGNNLFAFVVFLSAMQPGSASFLLLIFGGLVLLLSAEDPLRKAPPERLALWPLTTHERIAVRIASLALSPILWLALVAGIVTRRWQEALLLVSASVVWQVIHGAMIRTHRQSPAKDLRRLIPRIPGRWGALVTLHLRQMFLLLDTYVAILLVVSVQLYVHLVTNADREALPVIAILTALTLSTHTQGLFGLDGPATAQRYRLWPLRGWEALLAKDLAFLTVLFLLVLPNSVLAGMAGGLAALVIGHRISVEEELPQRRWRFSGGQLAPTGLIQIVAVFVAGFGLRNSPDPRWLALATTAWLGSLWYYGRRLDRGARLP